MLCTSRMSSTEISSQLISWFWKISRWRSAISDSRGHVHLKKRTDILKFQRRKMRGNLWVDHSTKAGSQGGNRKGRSLPMSWAASTVLQRLLSSTPHTPSPSIFGASGASSQSYFNVYPNSKFKTKTNTHDTCSKLSLATPSLLSDRELMTTQILFEWFFTFLGDRVHVMSNSWTGRRSWSSSKKWAMRILK